jgi:1-phosphofructokinase family hexose kinase
MIPTVTLNPALDRTLYVERLVPGDTNRILKTETDAGGKGLNVSRILHPLGTPTVCLGFVGGETGDAIERKLKEEGVPTDFNRIAEPTRVNSNVQNAVGDPPTLLHERGPSVTNSEKEQFLKAFQRYLSQSSFLVMGGTLPKGLPEDFYSTLMEQAQSHGVKTVLDVDGVGLEKALAAQPYFIKPNRTEAERLAGRSLSSRRDFLNAARELRVRYGVELVVVSLGEEGAIAASERESVQAYPPEVPVVSTIGCGDSMVAGVLHVLAQGGPLDEALRYGSAAGAATAMTDGSGIGNKTDILRLLSQVRVERFG